jgi:N-acyl-D-amino-acid deacylase
MRTIAALLAGLVLTNPLQADDAPGTAVKAAVEKSLKRIETGLINYPKHRQCFSCHHQAVAVFSMTAARQRGFAVDADLLKKQIEFSLRTFRNKAQIVRGTGVGGESTSVVYILNTLAAADYAPDDTTAALVEYLLVRQRKDGAWPIPFDRPPTMGSSFTNTGLALFALKKYGPAEDEEGAEELHRRVDTALGKGLAWLLANKPVTTEDKVFHLRGLVFGGAATREIEAARERLVKDQSADGSWAQLADMAGDAYATATVLVALRHAGLDVEHEAYKKGIKYLLDTQKEDGAWIVQTRSRPLQVFFDNGDPGGKSQFISFAATNWAVLALLEGVPPPAPGGQAP